MFLTNGATYLGELQEQSENWFLLSGVNAISIGGASATTLNLGRTGQTQALLGNGTVAGTGRSW